MFLNVQSGYMSVVPEMLSASKGNIKRKSSGTADCKSDLISSDLSCTSPFLCSLLRSPLVQMLSSSTPTMDL